MSEVPPGVARLLSRATRPALPVGNTVGFAAANPFAPALLSEPELLDARERPTGDPARRAPIGTPRPIASLPEAESTDTRDAPAAAPASSTSPARRSTRQPPSRSAEPAMSAAHIDAPESAPAARATIVSQPHVVAMSNGLDGDVAYALGGERDDGDRADHAQSAPQRVRPSDRVRADVVRRSPAAAATDTPVQHTEPTAATAARPAPAPPPVVIGQITVQVTNPEPAPDPFAGCRALADGITAKRGGGW